MNYLEFSKVFGNNNVIDVRNVLTYFDGLDRRRLYEWQQKGYLTKLANNYYVFADKPADDLVLKDIYCRLYSPSYVGLESALSYYNFIPEAVFQQVGVTTRRNKVIGTRIGDFCYRSIKPALFFGYDVAELQDTRFFISDPEKTLLDFLYFHAGTDKKETLTGLRLNQEEIRQRIDPHKLNRYLRLFSSPKLNRAAKVLLEMADVES